MCIYVYPLEVSADECSSNMNIKESAQPEPASDTEISQQRPARRAMIKVKNKLAKWTELLCGPPEDVEDDN